MTTNILLYILSAVIGLGLGIFIKIARLLKPDDDFFDIEYVIKNKNMKNMKECKKVA